MTQGVPGSVRINPDTKSHLNRLQDTQAARLGVRPGQGLSFDRLIAGIASLADRYPDELTEILRPTTAAGRRTSP